MSNDCHCDTSQISLEPSRNIADNTTCIVKTIHDSKKPVSTRKLKIVNTIPDSILHDSALNQAISLLPSNYNFEIHKSIWRIQHESYKAVAIQFPEGLLMYACIISDIIEKFTEAKVIILGDVTYGACCIDDYTANKLGANLLIHYGHSCLVPISTTKIKVLYVFVEIQFDTTHLVSVLTKHFSFDQRIALMGTIQFASALHLVINTTRDQLPHMRIPQSKPLSPGETLGCTSAKLNDCDCIVFVADGRFHLEAAMIQNPDIPAFRYDPYSKVLTSEGYDTVKMKEMRWREIVKARDGVRYGLILGTLGRQGNISLYGRLKNLLKKHNKKYVQFLMAEINPSKLLLMSQIDVWVQIACPRLSIDWGSQLAKPLLSSYEAQVALGEVPWMEVYPMDYYSASGDSWSNHGK